MSDVEQEDSKAATAVPPGGLDGVLLANAAYEIVRKDIISAELPPGMKLQMGMVCRRYGIGSSPMREALTRLAGEGFVARKDNRGFFVAEVSAEELQELTETRCWVEDIAIRKSIANGDRGWEDGVVLSFHRLSRIPQPAGGTLYDSDVEWLRLHNAFHDSLIAACGSRWLLEFCKQLRDQAYRYRRLTSEERARLAVKEHEAIMKATLARDADAAADLLAAHYRKTSEIALRRGFAGPGAKGRKPRS